MTQLASPPERKAAERSRGLDEQLKDLAARDGMLLVLILLTVLAAVLTRGNFVSPSNIVTLLYQSSILGVLVIGQGLAILTRGLDLSVGAVTTLAAIVMGGMSSDQQLVVPFLGLVPAIAIGLGVAGAIGFVNGVVVATTRIPAFIVTLAMLLAVSGLSYLLTDGAPIYYPDEFFVRFGGGKFWLIPYSVVAWLLLLVAAHLFLTRTKFGPMIYAIGGNERAALLSGLDVPKVKILVYTISGLMAGAAGFLFLARTGYATPSPGDDYLLASVAAVVVGGIGLAGGRGGIKDALVGVLILAILGNLMTLLGVPPHLQSAVRGAAILLAVMANARLARGTAR